MLCQPHPSPPYPAALFYDCLRPNETVVRSIVQESRVLRKAVRTRSDCTSLWRMAANFTLDPKALCSESTGARVENWDPLTSSRTGLAVPPAK